MVLVGLDLLLFLYYIKGYCVPSNPMEECSESPGVFRQSTAVIAGVPKALALGVAQTQTLP